MSRRSHDVHCAVVLAAGGSRRLGRPKQLLTRDGESLLRRATRLAAATHPRRTIVVLGADSGSMEAELTGLACTCAFNPAWRSGLAGSLKAAAASLAAHTGPVLIIGCDQPALEQGHLQALLAGAEISASGCAATLHGDLPGIPAVVPSAMLQETDRLSGDRGLGQRLRELTGRRIFRHRAPELMLDIDTPQDLDDAIAAGWIDRREGHP